MGDRGRSRIEELEKQGWIRQFTASEPRLSEAAALYRDLGFEVRLELLPKKENCHACTGDEREDPEECRTCFDGFEEQYRVIFTRPARKDEPRNKHE